MLAFILDYYNQSITVSQPFWQTACGKKINYKAETDTELTEDLHKFIQEEGFKVQIGNTIATNDFYEGNTYSMLFYLFYMIKLRLHQ